MHPDVAARLLALNREFYQRFAPAFASKRSRLQPGAARVAGDVQIADSVLDLGSGHGLLAEALHQAGHRARFVGIDSSRGLLELARRSVHHPSAVFLVGDLADPGWPDVLGSQALPPFDWVFALAVLHHLPGEELRRRIAGQARSLLAPGGRMVVSVWDFLASRRWAERLLPWDRAGLTADRVDPDDYLLDWREGGLGIRYVHHFTAETLENLAQSAGFRVGKTFRSDGEAGRLGLYQIWQEG